MFSSIVLLMCLLVLHGPWHERIAAVNQALEATPKDASLYFQRGELYRLDRNWECAEADYLRALELDPGLTRVELGRAQALRAQGEYTAALEAILRLLETEPDDLAGRRERARILVAQERWSDADQTYLWLLAHQRPLTPELVIEAATAAGHLEPGGSEQALLRLDLGVEALGPLATLQLPAVEFERKLGRYERAVARIATVEASAARKELWQVRRGELWWEAGEKAKARAALEDAQQSIASLSPARRSTRAVQQLQARIDALLSSDRTEDGCPDDQQPKNQQPKNQHAKDHHNE